MDKIRIGVIGVGSIAREHLNAYKKNPHVEIYALCDINAELLASRAAEFGVERTFTNCEDMLKLPEIDAVSVCTWNCAHAPCAIAALNAGKHVLCEKPAARIYEEALAMQEAQKRTGKILNIGVVNRFNTNVNKL